MLNGEFRKSNGQKIHMDLHTSVKKFSKPSQGKLKEEVFIGLRIQTIFEDPEILKNL